jgi:hypothetical protein
MQSYEDEYNQALEPGDLGTTYTPPVTKYAVAKSDAAPAPWQAGYDTLLKQMGAIQSKADVYKRRSPLEASTHIDNIAKSLAKDYGITNLSDIGVRYETRPAYETGSDESRTIIPEEQLPIYYNKNNPSQIIPGYKFASEGAGKGFSNYNLQPVSDGKGGTIVVPVQEYSKSGLGAFVEDLGPILPVINIALMAAGVPPLAVGAGNLALQGAAGNVNDFNDALRIAAPFIIPAGLQGLDVVGPSTAATTAGRIAENYSGLTGIGADVLGGGLSGAVKAGLTGGDVLTNALTGAVAPGLSAAGRTITSGLKDAFGGLTGFDYGANLNDMGGSALEGFGPTTTDTNAGVVNLTGAGANDIFGNLTDDELNDLYGSTAPNTTGALTSGVTLGSIDPKAITNLSVDTMAGAGAGASATTAMGMPNQDELDNMDSVTHNGKTYYYTGGNSLDVFGGSPNAAVYVQDANGNLSIAGTDEFQEALIGSGAGLFDTSTDTSGLSKVTVTGKNEVPSGRLTLSDAGTTPTVDPNLLATLTNLTQIAAVTSGSPITITSQQVATIDTKTTGALNTSQIAATNTSQISTVSTSQFNALTSTQIASLVGTVGTGLLLSDITKGGGTPATTTPAAALTTGLTALDTKNITALTSGATALSTSQVGALTTMNALGLQGIADPTNRYWQQTGVAGTGGQGGVRYFDWSTSQTPSMGGSNLAAATALSSVPAFTSAQAAAMTAPAGKQYFNAATNRYYTDPTGQLTPPAGFVQKTFKDGGEVETKHFNGGGFSFADYDLGIDPYNFADFDLGIGSGLDNVNFADYDLGIDPNTMSDADVESYLRGLPSDNASYGDIDRTASYQQDIKDAAAASGSSTLSGAAKTVVDKLAGLGAKLTQSALNSIANNPGAWLTALAGAGLGYAASKNNTVSPMGLQSLGLTQPQVYGALKGVPIGRAEGGEIDGYAGGGGLHYLKGAEDGMADKIPATIDNKQPARLSGGEFVIPADVVSHLGNGNSEAGAKQLYEMMDRIRHARTGTKEQGKQINPAKFTPK